MQGNNKLDETEVVIDQELNMSCKIITWRNICALCSIIVIFHIVLTISMSGFSVPSANADDSKEPVNSYVSPQKVRKKRNILDVTNSMDNSELKSPQIIMKQHSINGAKRKTSSDEWHSNGLCQNGHAQDIITQCEAVGCLRKLRLPSHDIASYMDGRVSKEILNELQMSNGRLHRIHIDLVSVLTDIQWNYGLFGSVAVLGDNSEIMAKLMAVNADIAEGEHVFIAPDSSDNVNEYLLDEISILDSSLNHQNIHLYPGYTNFSKDYLLQKDIPQFRFVSISLQDNFSALPHLIHLSTCIIREGGIVVLDNLKTEKVTEFVRHYFTSNGEATIVPLLATDNRLYLSSPRWKHVYTEQLLQRHSHFLSLHLQKDHIFNSAYTYLSSGEW